MSEIGANEKIIKEELNKLINNIFNFDAVAILEKCYCAEDEKPDFFDIKKNLKGDFSDWDKGRIFNDDSEIRWERKQEHFHVVFVSDKKLIPENWDKKEITKEESSSEVLLWGKRINNKNEWYEKQIPKILTYPSQDNGERVYIKIQKYTIEDDNSNIYRFKGVI